MQFNKREITTFCKRHHVISLALFGSALTTRFSPKSDVDILVKFDKKHIPLVGMRNRLIHAYFDVNLETIISELEKQ